MRGHRLNLVWTAGILAVSLGMSFPQTALSQCAIVNVDPILESLGDDSIDTREMAQRQLKDVLLGDRLCAEDIKKVHDAAVMAPDAEVRARAAEAFQEYGLQVPEVKSLADKIKFKSMPFRDRGMPTPFTNFMLDQLGGVQTGTIDTRDATQAGILDRLDRGSAGIRRAILIGDNAKAAADIESLKGFVNAIPDEVFDEIFGGAGVSRQELIDHLMCVNSELGTARDALLDRNREVQYNFMTPRHVDVARPGPIDTGGTFMLGVSNVVEPGTLDVFIADPAYGRADPPPGYHFVGQVFDVIADPSLLITGPVIVGFEYSPLLRLGNPVRLDLELSLVRIASGNVQLLPTALHDEANFMLFATYDPGPGLLDQFGEFALVQTPLPASGLLLVLGASVTLPWMVRRKGSDLRRGQIPRSAGTEDARPLSML